MGAACSGVNKACAASRLGKALSVMRSCNKAAAASHCAGLSVGLENKPLRSPMR